MTKGAYHKPRLCGMRGELTVKGAFPAHAAVPLINQRSLEIRIGVVFKLHLGIYYFFFTVFRLWQSFKFHSSYCSLQ